MITVLVKGSMLISTLGDCRRTIGRGLCWTGYRAHEELFDHPTKWTSARDHIAVVFKRS